MYLAFHGIKNILDIDTAKETDRLKRIDKRVRRGLPAEEPEPEPEVEEVKIKRPTLPMYGATSKKKVEVVEEVAPRPTDENKELMEKYGRYWMFVNYFSEEEDYLNLWQQGASSLKRVNPAVVVDIEDHILL